MSISKSQVGSAVTKTFATIITGDGASTVFTIEHGLNNKLVTFCARDAQDSLRQVIIENYPDPNDLGNRLIVEFEFPPSAGQSYWIILTG